MNTKQIHEAVADGAGFHTLSVTNIGKGSRRPAISFLADWLPNMGFISGALVKVLPAPDGEMVFSLCNENIRCYSELYTTTQESGGKLIQAYRTIVRQKESPALAISGQILYDAGFSIGDILIARYEYGLIRVRRLPHAARVVYARSRTSGEKTAIKLTGNWLLEQGFTPYALLTSYCENGCITYKLQDEGIDKYSELVRFARKNKMKLLEVREVSLRGKRLPLIEVTKTCLNSAGISASELLLAFCEHGLIKLQKLHMNF
jgi:hypothetical protein